MDHETNVLDQLLSRVTDETLRSRLAREIELLRGSRRFGLVFDRHLPESVKLTDHPIRKGVKVALRDESSALTWRVVGFADMTRTVAVLDGDGGEQAVADLVVVREFGEPIYPGLQSIERIQNGPADAPWHTVINGENFHVLQALRWTHRGAVDIIYIDPPYNTGGKTSWLYNDRFVDRADRAKSSKWLSFMERRLKIARDLLKPSGVIFISIGDDEQHRLRMLMDQVFGVENFVNLLAIEMSTTSGPKTTNAQDGIIVKNIEFVLVYQRSDAFDQITHTPLLDGVAEWDSHYSMWLNEDGTITKFVDELAADPAVAADIKKFGFVNSRGEFLGMRCMDKLLTVSDAANKFVLSHLDQIARPDSPPVSCKDIDAPVQGWIDVEADHRTYTLTRLSTGTLNQVYRLSRNYRTSDDYRPRYGRTVIRGDLWKGFHSDMGNIAKEGGVNFNNGKKPVRLIKQLIRWANNSPNAVVLDFFGGSGSTTHAVMDMNAEDDGRRQSILVTNNEVGIDVANSLRKKGIYPGDAEWESKGVFENVCRPRISTVVTGARPDGSKYSDGLAANVEMFRLTYLDPGRVRRGSEYGLVAPLMWMEGGARGERVDEVPDDGWALTESYGVLFSIDALTPFANAVAKAAAGEAPPQVLFIITDSPTEYQTAVERLPTGIETVRLYDEYLSNYTINIPGGAR
ncbi:site-specific DNA-methyltransferase [Nonomuraea helvata]|uniref:Site-specific DNA-methyltransferase n=1 Tax=Nonomuraea helvata TaxID=37484 RepID=A0ABV5RRL3_9ACTN